MDDFLWRAALAGVGVAAMTGPVGCLLVWRRMAFFGDTLAHAALLGVALGLLLGVNIMVGVAATSALLAVLLAASARQRLVPSDTVLAILSHGGLAAGVIVLTLLPGVRVNLMGFLFGDILAVTRGDLILILAVGLVVLTVLAVIWRQALAVAVDEDLARADGVAADRINLTVVLLAALVVAAAIKVVGILLVAALMIMPAAAARRFARTPEHMVIGTVVVGVAAVFFGLAASLLWDTPAGPSIVAAIALLVVLAWLTPRRTRSA
jgi:zinc transport system permease protein